MILARDIIPEFGKGYPRVSGGDPVLGGKVLKLDGLSPRERG